MNEEVAKLYQEGVSYRSIAKRLGLSVGQVAGIINRLGIAKRGQPRCFSASKGRKTVVFESAREFEEPKPSPHYSPKQRAAYEVLRKAVENTR